MIENTNGVVQRYFKPLACKDWERNVKENCLIEINFPVAYKILLFHFIHNHMVKSIRANEILITLIKN